MGKRKNVILSMIFVGALAGAAAAQTQTADQTQPRADNPSTLAPVTTANQAIDRIIAREHDEIATIRRYSPIIETYIQDMRPDKDMGAVPVRDHYFLGQADLSRGVVDNSMISAKKGKLDQLNPIAHLGGYFTSSYVPDGFLQMIYIDMNGLDRQHYQFDYVRREFLGDVRCVVFRRDAAAEIRQGPLQRTHLGRRSELHHRALQRCLHSHRRYQWLQPALR